MITDGQAKELWRLLDQGKQLAFSSRMTQMDEKTARDYRDDRRLPSQRKKKRVYRTRLDPFSEVWAEVIGRLELEPRLKAKTLFEWLQHTYPARYPDSMRRTFERGVAKWRALNGPGKTVFFPQDHQPGRLAASDFTNCNELRVTINRIKFDHMLFHCVLTYSNIESVSLCFSESFEALSQGIQDAFWEFGGVPERHRTDSLSAAVLNHSNRKLHTERYLALMEHYRSIPERTNARCANENGDVESSNRHLKDRIDQALLLRGSREFASREDYVRFVKELVANANSHRQDRFAEEQMKLGKLPDLRLDTDDLVSGIHVSTSSTIQVRANTYSVPSRLIGYKVDARIGAEEILISYQGHTVQTMPRLFGKNLKSINFRHVIDSLVRKPGAFANYRFREEMFPTSRFRVAYDMLRSVHTEAVADKKYLQILELAAHESLEAVVDALRIQIDSGLPIDVDGIKSLVEDSSSIPAATDIDVEPPNLNDFDSLLHTFDKECQENGDEYQKAQQVDSDNYTEDRPIHAVEGTVSGATVTELPRQFPRSRDTSGERKTEPSGLSLGTDTPGMRVEERETSQATPSSIETTVRQKLEQLPVRSTSHECEEAIGNTPRRLLLGETRECLNLWETRFGEESRIMCIGGAASSPGSQHDVYDMQFTGTATLDCEAGPSVASHDQAAIEDRRLNHRRLGIRSTRSGRDGSVIHFTGRALRTRECSLDEQSSIQQMGSDLQGCHDDCSGNRQAGASQCDHRDERTELSSRNCQTNQINWPTW
jgi:hypothetical protein